MLPDGTYNGHLVPTAAEIATIEKLMRDNGDVYEHFESMGASLEQVPAARGIEGYVARHGSAFCLYFAVDWHDLAMHHTPWRTTRCRVCMVVLWT